MQHKSNLGEGIFFIKSGVDCEGIQNVCNKSCLFFINSTVVFFSGMAPQTLVCILLPLKGDHFTFPCVSCVLSKGYSYALTLVEGP